MNILFITPEAVPFAKTGGLADVAGIMPRVLAGSQSVSLIIPGYKIESSEAIRTVPTDEFLLPIAGEMHRAAIEKFVVSSSFTVYFVKNEEFFNREHLYGGPDGDYPDNFSRFLFFQKSCLEFARRKGLRFDIVHCHDWQTALVPLFMKIGPQAEVFRGAKAVFTIHNLGYQGVFPASSFGEIGLPESYFSPDFLEFYGQLNCMKAGIIFSDCLTTVSPTYAREILDPEMGFGLDGLLRKYRHKLIGILNGVDYGQWDPGIDPFICRRYTIGSLEDKGVNKADLFAKLGITQGPNVPLVAMISRISEQKGMKLLLELLPALLQEDVHFAFLGVGDSVWTERLHEMASRFPKRMTFVNRFDEGMAHRLQAAADILFMPSVYEPCGLNQIYALRYGTVPVVRATGGLQDSVEEFDSVSRRGTGLKFAGSGGDEALAAIHDALHRHADPGLWRQIQKNGMGMDFSWERVVPNYLTLYRNTLLEEHQHG